MLWPKERGGEAVGHHCWKHFFVIENTCTGAGLGLMETASEPTAALRDQLHRWKQSHMHLLTSN